MGTAVGAGTRGGGAGTCNCMALLCLTTGATSWRGGQAGVSGIWGEWVGEEDELRAWWHGEMRMVVKEQLGEVDTRGGIEEEEEQDDEA